MGPATDKIPVLCYRLARSAVLLVLLAVNNAISSNEPSLQTRDKTERVRPYNRFVAFQGFHGGKVRIDVAQLLQDQADAAWAEDTPASTNTNNAKKSTTYSVIVVHWRTHPSNLFRDQERVRAFANSSRRRRGDDDNGTGRGDGGVVGSVQFASPFPPAEYDDAGWPPFFVAHPEGADTRVRVVHATDLVEEGFELDPRQVSHLKASCENPSETTILVMVDETCERPKVPLGMPSACLSNIVRIYPFNTASADAESRNAYMPLGPRDTFPFVVEGKRRPASQRTLLFNLEVTARTSKRRDELIGIVRRYTNQNPDLPCASQGGMMNAEEWQDLLLDSKFTLSPGGHNAETFRTWEALEAGSIPIVSKLDFTTPAYNTTTNCGVGMVAWNVVAASPFAKEVSVNDWTELPALLNSLRRQSDDYINRLQAASYEWYSALMEQTYESMLNFGEGHELLPQEGPIVDHGIW